MGLRGRLASAKFLTGALVCGILMFCVHLAAWFHRQPSSQFLCESGVDDETFTRHVISQTTLLAYHSKRVRNLGRGFVLIAFARRFSQCAPGTKTLVADDCSDLIQPFDI